MNKIMLFVAVALVMASCSGDNGSVTIKLPDDFTGKTLVEKPREIDPMEQREIAP